LDESVHVLLPDASVIVHNLVPDSLIVTRPVGAEPECCGKTVPATQGLAP
jgi:hypothetical protein